MPDIKSLVPDLPTARFVSRGRYKISYFVVGPADGRPLFLVHGLSASGLQFVDDAAYFADKGFLVIVPDLRGHGRSISPDRREDAEFTISAMAQDLIAVLDAENIQTIDWVGNSMGGILALSLMGTDRSRIGKFISFGTAYTLRTPKITAQILRWVYKIFGADFLAKLTAPLTCNSKQARAVIYEMIRNTDMDAVIRVTRDLVYYDLTENGLNFKGPMLMIAGVRDSEVNKALVKSLPVLKALPNFEYIDLDEAGHCANLDQPKIVREIITKFLAK